MMREARAQGGGGGSCFTQAGRMAEVGTYDTVYFD